MSSINNVGGNSPIQPTATPVNRKPADAATPAPARGADRLELSGVSHLLKSLKTNDIRTDKVANIKSQIEAGTYEDDAKLNAATDRLLDDLVNS